MRSHLLRPLCTALTALSGVGCADAPVGPASMQASLRAAAAKQPTTDMPVVSMLLPSDIGPLSLSDDGLEVYQNGQQGVSSLLQGATGDWLLDVSGSTSTRAVHVDLSNALADNPQPAPFAAALVRPRIISKASDVRAGGLASMVGLGSMTLTPLSLAFSYGGKSYGLRMNPANHARTDWARAECVAIADAAAPATSRCTQWEITPGSMQDGVARSVAYLEEVTRKGSVAVGHYALTFRINVAR